MTPFHFLITGFGPFLKCKLNPSGEVVRVLSEQGVGGLHLTTAILPVTLRISPPRGLHQPRSPSAEPASPPLCSLAPSRTHPLDSISAERALNPPHFGSRSLGRAIPRDPRDQPQPKPYSLECCMIGPWAPLFGANQQARSRPPGSPFSCGLWAPAKIRSPPRA